MNKNFQNKAQIFCKEIAKNCHEMTIMMIGILMPFIIVLIGANQDPKFIILPVVFPTAMLLGEFFLLVIAKIIGIILWAITKRQDGLLKELASLENLVAEIEKETTELFEEIRENPCAVASIRNVIEENRHVVRMHTKRISSLKKRLGKE